MMQAHPLPGLKCIDGSTPVVWANASSAGVTEWVIQIGSQSIGTSFCISPFHCKLFAAPPAKPTPPPPPMTVSNAGPQSSNCTWNPSFCEFNQAQISDCTLDLLLGSGDTTISGVTMHMDGQALLKASLAKLGTLGLSSATRVLLNGVGWGGTSVILNADTVGAQLKTIAPKLTDYRAVAADGVHTRTPHVPWDTIKDPKFDALTGPTRHSKLCTGFSHMHVWKLLCGTEVKVTKISDLAMHGGLLPKSHKGGGA